MAAAVVRVEVVVVLVMVVLVMVPEIVVVVMVRLWSKIYLQSFILRSKRKSRIKELSGKSIFFSLRPA